MRSTERTYSVSFMKGISTQVDLAIVLDGLLVARVPLQGLGAVAQTRVVVTKLEVDHNEVLQTRPVGGGAGQPLLKRAPHVTQVAELYRGRG